MFALRYRAMSETPRKRYRGATLFRKHFRERMTEYMHAVMLVAVPF